MILGDKLTKTMCQGEQKQAAEMKTWCCPSARGSACVNPDRLGLVLESSSLQKTFHNDKPLCSFIFVIVLTPVAALVFVLIRNRFACFWTKQKSSSPSS